MNFKNKINLINIENKFTGLHINTTYTKSNTFIKVQNKNKRYNNNKIINNIPRTITTFINNSVNINYDNTNKQKNILLHDVSLKTINFTNKININNVDFYSGSFSITNCNDGYILCFRYLNYFITYDNICINNDKINNATINKFLKINKDYNIIHENELIIPNVTFWDKSKYNYDVLGVEDVRIINYNEEFKIIGVTQNSNNKIGISIGDYNYNENKITNLKFIEPNFNSQKVEKNWVYFKNISNKLLIIYKWYPLQICNIFNNELNLIHEIKMPEFFINARGSSCGFNYNNELWFIIHCNNDGDYYHSIVVFNEHVVLKKHTSWFKFKGYKIEFCIGLYIENDKLILPYSIYDNQSYIDIYDMNTINNLNWIIY